MGATPPKRAYFAPYMGIPIRGTMTIAAASAQESYFHLNKVSNFMSQL